MTFADYLQTQPLLRIAVALIIGIVVGDKFAGLVPLWILLAIIVVCLIVELLFKKFPYLQSFLIFVGVFLVGTIIVTKADYDVADPFRDDIPINYEAVVVGEPQAKGKVLRCDIAITKVDYDLLKAPVKVKVSILRDTVNNNWQRIKLGSGIKAMSVMQPLVNFRKGSNFDYVRWLHCHGFKAQTFIYYSDWQLARVSLAPLSWLERVRLKALKFRKKLISQLTIYTDNEDQQSAVIAAMVLGDKHAISSDTKDDYSISGASHVLALSGLHLGIIYAILTLLFGGGYKRRWLSQALIVIAIWAYVVLVGMGTSVVRSAVMLTIYSIGYVAGRDKTSVNSLSLAAIIILITNPLSLWEIGFQMSFMAVLSIVVFCNRTMKKIWAMIIVSLAAQIGTAPLIAYYFGRFSCYFLLTNIVVIPCATIIIYGTIVVFLTMPIPSLCNIVAKVLTFVASFLNGSVSWIASLPGASIENIHVNTLQLFCYYILVTIICIAYTYLRKLKTLKKLDAFNS